MSILLLTALLAGSSNFDARDDTLVQAAEDARWRSAMFWSGRPLSGNWSRPCPITVRSSQSPASGVTRFRFDRGEVFGWSMALSGQTSDILANVLPHEVDHMVRATLTRGPILRWLDEGSAALFESPNEHRRLRTLARDVARSGRPLTFLDSSDYPRDGRTVAELYAVGFSLVEHLLRRGEPQQLLALQTGGGTLSEALQETYGITADRLVADWRRDVLRRDGSDCASHGCRFHGGRSHEVQRLAVCQQHDCPAANVMVVWTASWCRSCRTFWSDYQNDPAYRAAIDARVHLHVVDASANPSRPGATTSEHYRRSRSRTAVWKAIAGSKTSSDDSLV